MQLQYKIFVLCFSIAISILQFSCKKLVEVPPPRTDLITKDVFASDATANAAMLNIYRQLMNSGFASGTGTSITYIGAICSDDALNFRTDANGAYNQFYDNKIQANNIILGYLWESFYTTIYNTNSIIEGINISTGMTENMKTQLGGEARFVRALSYFYLVNLWGDVPLTLTTDYRVNNTISRTNKETVYQQVIADLKDAQNMLPVDYTFANNERVRASKGAATALLARVYLYLEDWVNAEQQATDIISNTSLYNLSTDLALVFRGAGREPIFQLWFQRFPQDRGTFFVYSFGPIGGTLRPEFVESFDPEDQRWPVWGQTMEFQGTPYYGVLKYRDFSNPPLDYTTVLRLAEQYLIRAEARAKQGKLIGLNSAETDINAIRNRAGLPNTTASTEGEVLLAIEQERRFELFGEWGHRWFDIKRTGRANDILSSLKPDWQAYKEYFPIPESQIINDPNVSQNQGY